MGKNSRAGKPGRAKKLDNQIKREIWAAQKELEKDYARAMLPVAVQEAFLLLISLSCIVLHDYYGFGKKRLGAFAEHLLDYYDSLEKRYVTLDEVIDEITRMTGLRYALTKEEADTLTYYGLKGLLHEVQFSAEQKAYWADRRARGWISNENRYGQVVR